MTRSYWLTRSHWLTRRHDQQLSHSVPTVISIRCRTEASNEQNINYMLQLYARVVSREMPRPQLAEHSLDQLSCLGLRMYILMLADSHRTSNVTPLSFRLSAKWSCSLVDGLASCTAYIIYLVLLVEKVIDEKGTVAMALVFGLLVIIAAILAKLYLVFADRIIPRHTAG